MSVPAVGMVDQACPTARPDGAAPETTGEQRERDWANLCRFEIDNSALQGKARPRVVFIGDSITEGWLATDPPFFTNGVINRGISGQTTPQMLVRFYADVISLHPRAVHILAGTNDIAGNTGPNTAADYEHNIRAMSELATVHHIKVILGSIPPADRFSWRPQLHPSTRIVSLNQWLKGYAKAHKFIYVDYYQALAASDGSLPVDLSADGVHPNARGYAVMRPLAARAMAQALR